MLGLLWTGMKNTIASIATGSALCGALLLSGATGAHAARPDDRGPQVSVISAVALHNDTAENGSDCPNATKDWWHFVIAPNNGRYTITEMTLNLDGSAVTVSAGSIVANGHQTDNVFVQVPSGSSLESLVAAGSSATVSGPDTNARLMLSHLCDGNDQDIDDKRDDDQTDNGDDDTDDLPGNDDQTNNGDDDTDDLPGNDDQTDNGDDDTDDLPGNDDQTNNGDDDTDDLPGNDDQTNNGDDEITVADDADAPVDEAPAEQDADDEAVESPAPEKPMLQAATATEAPVGTASAPQANKDPATDSITSNADSGFLPATGASLPLLPALVLIGLGTAARRTVTRRS